MVRGLLRGCVLSSNNARKGNIGIWACGIRSLALEQGPCRQADGQWPFPVKNDAIMSLLRKGDPLFEHLFDKNKFVLHLPDKTPYLYVVH